MHSLIGLVTVFSLSNEARGVSFTAILAAGGHDGIEESVPVFIIRIYVTLVH